MMQKRFYHCFGCVHTVTLLSSFVAETTGLSYKEAAIKIAQENSIDLPKMTAAQKKSMMKQNKYIMF